VIFWGNNPGNIDPKALLAERQDDQDQRMKFKALVRYASTISTETLTLLPLHPLHVVIACRRRRLVIRRRDSST